MLDFLIHLVAIHDLASNPHKEHLSSGVVFKLASFLRSQESCESQVQNEHTSMTVRRFHCSSAKARQCARVQEALPRQLRGGCPLTTSMRSRKDMACRRREDMSSIIMSSKTVARQLLPLTE